MPAARSASASSSIATPSQLAPPASAARAAGTMPWPYPSALTTAISSAAVWDFRVATLARDGGQVDDGLGTHHGPQCVKPAAVARARVGGVPAGHGAVRPVQPADRGRHGRQQVAGHHRAAGRGPLAGQPVQVGAGGRGQARRQAGGQQRADQAGQHVAAAGGGEPGVPVGLT